MVKKKTNGSKTEKTYHKLISVGYQHLYLSVTNEISPITDLLNNR